MILTKAALLGLVASLVSARLSILDERGREIRLKTSSRGFDSDKRLRELLETDIVLWDNANLGDLFRLPASYFGNLITLPEIMAIATNPKLEGIFDGTWSDTLASKHGRTRRHRNRHASKKQLQERIDSLMERISTINPTDLGDSSEDFVAALPEDAYRYLNPAVAVMSNSMKVSRTALANLFHLRKKDVQAAVQKANKAAAKKERNCANQRESASKPQCDNDTKPVVPLMPVPTNAAPTAPSTIVSLPHSVDSQPGLGNVPLTILPPLSHSLQSSYDAIPLPSPQLPVTDATLLSANLPHVTLANPIDANVQVPVQDLLNVPNPIILPPSILPVKPLPTVAEILNKAPEGPIQQATERDDESCSEDEDAEEDENSDSMDEALLESVEDSVILAQSVSQSMEDSTVDLDNFDNFYNEVNQTPPPMNPRASLLNSDLLSFTNVSPVDPKETAERGGNSVPVTSLGGSPIIDPVQPVKRNDNPPASPVVKEGHSKTSRSSGVTRQVYGRFKSTTNKALSVPNPTETAVLISGMQPISDCLDSDSMLESRLELAQLSDGSDGRGHESSGEIDRVELDSPPVPVAFDDVMGCVRAAIRSLARLKRPARFVNYVETLTQLLEDQPVLGSILGPRLELLTTGLIQHAASMQAQVSDVLNRQFPQSKVRLISDSDSDSYSYSISSSYSDDTEIMSGEEVVQKATRRQIPSFDFQDISVYEETPNMWKSHGKNFLDPASLNRNVFFLLLKNEEAHESEEAPQVMCIKHQSKKQRKKANKQSYKKSSSKKHNDIWL